MKRKWILSVLMLCCFSCSVNNPSGNALSETPGELLLTNTSSPPPIEFTPTMTKTIAQTNTPTIEYTRTKTLAMYERLKGGEYLVYVDLNQPVVLYYIVSVTGEEEGTLNRKVRGGLIQSSDNSLIAFSGREGVGIYTLNDDSIYMLPDPTGCLGNPLGLSWGPTNDFLAAGCGDRIIIVNNPSGEVVGTITNPVLPEGQNFYTDISWSPNGKWIAYYDTTKNPTSGPSDYHVGLYVTEAACMTNESTCKWKSKLIEAEDAYPFSWTPSSQLAVYDFRERSFRFYDAESNVLSRTITLPETNYSLAGFVWSPEEEWIAVHGLFGNGIYIVSIETMEVKEVRPNGAVVLWLSVPE